MLRGNLTSLKFTGLQWMDRNCFHPYLVSALNYCSSAVSLTLIIIKIHSMLVQAKIACVFTHFFP